MSDKHAPTPWRIHPIDARDIFADSGGGVAVGTCFRKEDAAHIVRCVNAHTGLTAALIEALVAIENTADEQETGYIVEMGNKALAAAKGES